ncbi:hypothetical protein PQE16_gp33 [Arthrobacter phage Reedo]|uniref:Uncharacterized protein n=1 Tax=Arthrobacter phage Reedo TaxID=2910755 RepID=A0AA49BPG9_9CAUD|nr:hypothetical protein PQE16_gp33 [Arthrobacter phage Reedo]UJQ86823.1 hypothetical protein SEA_REEDO_33 [Arthrobacter phage Reedo]
MAEARIIHTTAEELRAKREELLREHPKLADVDPTEFCCSGCVAHDVAEVYGFEALDAWEALQEIEFLLGGS